MRIRLLLIVMLGIAAMGADCGGGSSSNGSPSASPMSIGQGEGGGDVAPPSVPEPGALLVFGAGLLLATAATRRR